MSGCSTMANPVMLDLQRKHAVKILESEREEVGECPIQDRIVAYRAFGKGYPVIFLPGNPNSRYFQPAWENSEVVALKSNFRVILVERPGVGLSTGPLMKSYSEFAGVVDRFTDAIGLTRFAIMGFSSGGPYSLACASHLPHKVSGLVLIAADAEYANPKVGLTFTEVYKAFTQEDLLTRGTDVTRQIVELFTKTYEQIKHETRRKMAIRDLQEATRCGLEGLSQDRVLEAQMWNIPIPPRFKCPVHIYHGTADTDVPPKCAPWFHEQLNPSELFMVEGENHAIVRRHFEPILLRLKQALAPEAHM